MPPRADNLPQIDEEIPAYLISEKRGFFDDSHTLWPKGSMIYWEGTPSPAFEPLNELAEIKLREYFTMLDEKANEVAKQNGKGHASIVNAFEARRRLQEMDRRRGISVDQEEGKPIMGAKNNGQRNARSIHEVRATPMMGHQGRYSVAPKQAEGKKNKNV